MINKFVWDDDTVDINEELAVEVELESKKEIPPRKRRKKKIFSSRILLIIIFITLFAVPLFKIKELNFQGNNFTTDEQLSEYTGFEVKERFSIAEYIISKIKISRNNEMTIHQKYSIKTGILTLKVDEIKPIYEKQSGEVYTLENEKIKITDEENYVVPLISDMSPEIEEKLAFELATLDYQIIKEISFISNEKSKTEDVTLQMKDGNYVEIGISQISSKMPYYLQISDILRNKKAKPGIIHLDIGDYYEPF